MIVRQRGSFAFVMDALRRVVQQSCPMRMQVAFSIADIARRASKSMYARRRIESAVRDQFRSRPVASGCRDPSFALTNAICFPRPP